MISILSAILSIGWFIPTFIFYLSDLSLGLYYALIGIWLNMAVNVLAEILRIVIYLCVGLKFTTISLARGPRDGWSSSILPSIISEYGERKIKVADAANRRMGHVMTHIFRNFIFIPYVVPSQTIRIWTYGLHYALFLLQKISIARSDGVFASWTYQGARMRDGVLGRVNLVSVTTSDLSLYPLALLWLQLSLGSRMDLSWVCAFVFQPTAWGDTFAELVGSFCGQLDFKVRGFGEVNKKTVEGTVACFLASFVACFSITCLPAFPPDDAFRINYIELSAIAAIAGTLAEVLSFRGTDNGLMTMASTAVVIALAR